MCITIYGGLSLPTVARSPVWWCLQWFRGSVHMRSKSLCMCLVLRYKRTNYDMSLFLVKG